jgi:periplasmic divalent cation tolerance protein
MKPHFAIALVTAPDLKTARKLGRAVLKGRLAACVNLVPKIESHYWWQGRIESGPEVLLLIKSSTARLAALEKCILGLHPYETPEFVIVPISAGNKRYLDWLASSLNFDSAL